MTRESELVAVGGVGIRTSFILQSLIDDNSLGSSFDNQCTAANTQPTMLMATKECLPYLAFPKPKKSKHHYTILLDS
jgi:hypothetical protein